MTTVEVTDSREYAQPAERLWAVFADPVTAASLDDRVAFVSSTGAPGTVDSSYELDLAMGPMRLRQRVQVVEAVRPTLLKAITLMEGRLVAVQTAHIEPTEAGCRVTWTVTMESSRLAAGQARRKASKELPRWLAAADRAAAIG